MCLLKVVSLTQPLEWRRILFKILFRFNNWKLTQISFPF